MNEVFDGKSIKVNFEAQVTVDDVEQIQHKIIARSKGMQRAKRDGKVAAKHAIACTRRLFTLAVKKGYANRNPVRDIEPLGITGKRSRTKQKTERCTMYRSIAMHWNHRGSRPLHKCF